jgi:uncharacterized protein (DUF1778 family)
MPTVDVMREAEISLRFTSEERDCLARAAALESDGDLVRFIADAAVKAAQAALQTDELCCKLLSSSRQISGTFH